MMTFILRKLASTVVVMLVVAVIVFLLIHLSPEAIPWLRSLPAIAPAPRMSPR